MAQKEEANGTVNEEEAPNADNTNNIDNTENAENTNENTNDENNKEITDSNVSNDKKSNNIHVPKDKKLKIESVKVKEAISENDIIFYDIHVKTVQNRWIVRKRYSEFEELHTMLQKHTNPSKLPVLPPKHYKFFTDHTDPKFIEQRRALLDNYVRRLNALDDVSTLQPVVNFFHDSKAIHIDDEIIQSEKNTENNNNNNNNIKNDKNEIDSNEVNELPDEKSENMRKASYDEQVAQLINESLSPNAKIVVKCADNYEFPQDQEITHLEIQSLRKMSDHVLYQILAKNVNREEPYDKWTVMKRFHSIYEMDAEIRQTLQDENKLDVLKEMPLMPEKKSKIIHDHMSEPFMEGRQVLLQNYFNKLLRMEEIAKNRTFLKFFGVDVGDD